MYRYIIGGGKTRILGTCKSRISIIGSNNLIEVSPDAYIDRGTKGRIIIRGSNNKLIIGSDCSIGPNCVFYLIGHNITIIIGKKTTITRDVEINAQECGMSIEIGEDCMFSNHITIRTSDSHPYYDKENVRLNHPKPVKIGNHVWIAPNTKIMKGSVIGDGAIIGSDTTVTKTVPENALYVGRPGKTIRTDVHWTREDICYK